jgi:hypothetical protein
MASLVSSAAFADPCRIESVNGAYSLEGFSGTTNLNSVLDLRKLLTMKGLCPAMNLRLRRDGQTATLSLDGVDLASGDSWGKRKIWREAFMPPSIPEDSSRKENGLVSLLGSQEPTAPRRLVSDVVCTLDYNPQTELIQIAIDNVIITNNHDDHRVIDVAAGLIQSGACDRRLFPLEVKRTSRTFDIYLGGVRVYWGEPVSHDDWMRITGKNDALAQGFASENAYYIKKNFQDALVQLRRAGYVIRKME